MFQDLKIKELDFFNRNCLIYDLLFEQRFLCKHHTQVQPLHLHGSGVLGSQDLNSEFMVQKYYFFSTKNNRQVLLHCSYNTYLKEIKCSDEPNSSIFYLKCRNPQFLVVYYVITCTFFLQVYSFTFLKQFLALV